MTATARVLDIAGRLRAPAQDALCDLVRALSPIAPAVDHLGHGLVQSLDQLGVAHQRCEQPVEGVAQGDEAAGRLAAISETGSDV